MLQLSFVNFKANSYIFVEDTPSNDRFFIIQTGKVSCYHETPISGSSLKILGPGDFIGVIPCMSGHSHTETVIASTDVTAIVVRRDQYPELIVHNTPIALKIIRYFAREMRFMNDTRAKMTVKKVSGTDSPEELFNIAQFYEDKGFEAVAEYGYYQYLKMAPTGANADVAKRRFASLRKRTPVKYLESPPENIRVYPKENMIFAEFQAGSDMYIIQEGSVRITRVIEDDEVTYALLRKGDMFGEMALLDNKPRSASAITHEDCKVLVVNASNFEQMVTSQPSFIARLTQMLGERVWSMYRQLVNGLLTDQRERMIDMLALQIEIMKVPGGKGVPYQTDFTPQDIVNMSGIPSQQQNLALNQLYSDQNVKVKNGKINIPEVDELIKQAAFYRNQQNRRLKAQS
ncbi:MAG: cyclic nucleotide-binding domain-containing protein [Treponema sp.]|nr:cyclic nucleotide-binding domain-containing protein [Treponema sp.]